MSHRPRFYIRRLRGSALAYRKNNAGVVRTLAGHLVNITYQFGDAVASERERAHEDRNWTPPFVRDRKTQRAMEKPAGPAGTRAWHKRPLMAIMGKIDRETVMTRARLCVQRQAAVARLRTIPKPLIRHMLRLGYRLPRDIEAAKRLTLRGSRPTPPWWAAS